MSLNVKIVLVVAAPIASIALTGCGDSGSTASPTTLPPLISSQPNDEASITHPVDAPLDAITTAREHCWNSVSDALLGRQRARDWIADHNAAYDAQREAGRADPTKLPEFGDHAYVLRETTPKCYEITARPDN